MEGIQNMEENRVEKKSRLPLVLGIVGICLLGALAAAWLVFCGWAGTHALPGSTVAGLEMGGLERQEVAERLTYNYAPTTIELKCGDESVTFVSGKAGLRFDTDLIMERITAQDRPYFLRGVAWLKALNGGESRSTDAVLGNFIEERYVSELLKQLGQAFDTPVVQHTFLLKDNVLFVTRGSEGYALPRAELETQLRTKLETQDYSDIVLESVITQPDEPDFASIAKSVYVEKTDAYMEPETHEIVEHVVGVELDVSAARAAFAGCKEGETVRVPLTLTEPEITTEVFEQLLFRDKLGQAISWVSGTENRLANVTLAGQFCHETILLPGEEFSYWAKIDPCTAAQGFKPAPSYLNGDTVDSIGGGICQMSSSIYTAALYANLEIVQRHQHTYAVGYLPDGSDAMVNGGAADFRFKNNTQFPIKIVVELENRNLTVQLWGTKTDDTYVKMEYIELERTPFEVFYQIDDTVPVGTTKEKVGGYTGRKNESYRCVYDGDGTLLSRTRENKNNYRKRDEIILINSADAYKYNVDPVTGEKLPQPVVTPDPGLAPDPGETVAPEVTPVPEEIPVPEVTPVPEDAGSTSEMPEWLRPV